MRLRRTRAGTGGDDAAPGARRGCRRHGRPRRCARPGRRARDPFAEPASREASREASRVRRRRRRDIAALLAGWTEDDLAILGAMFTRYNRAVAARYLDADAPLPDRAEPRR
ncbi:hypothetical protein [Actinocatenispora comari]|nr:hypothetical protein [Actinocatenispora comari]